MDIEARVDILEKDMDELKQSNKEASNNISDLKESMIELKCSIENNTKQQEKLTSYMETQKDKPNEWLKYIGFTIVGIIITYLLKSVGIF